MERRTEVVSVRLTKAERARLDKIGGPAALRRVLAPAAPIGSAPSPTTWACGSSRTHMAWFDGTVGQQWPALATS